MNYPVSPHRDHLTIVNRPSVLASVLAQKSLSIIGFISVGLLFAAYVVGWRVVNPFNVTWLVGDPATHHLGWSFFRNEERLTFPIGWSDAIGFPIGEPIAYLDSIPILAAVLWPFRHVLPENFQYLGPLFALNCILQLYFGYRISLYLSGNNRLVGWLGGLFFMTAPSFVWRAHGHFAISSHWLILAALDVYFRTDRQISKKMLATICAISFVAGSVNPYIALMVQMVVGATIIKFYLSEYANPDAKALFLKAAATLTLSLAVMGVAFVLFGFLRPGIDAGYAGGGYRMYSMNLLSPIDPHIYSSLLLRAQGFQFGQHEGYNYLGLGVLLLMTISISRKPAIIWELFRKEKAGLWIVVVTCLLFALSAKAVVGTKVLYDIHLPARIENALSAFRASGRFFWPAAYVLLCCAIVASVHAFGRRVSVVLAAMLVIQFADLNGLYKSIHDRRPASAAAVFTDKEEWQAIGKNHRHLVTMPAWQCGQNVTPGDFPGFWIFGKLAAKHSMTINSFYAGRYSATQIAYFCGEQPREIVHNGLQPDTAYVFATPASIIGLDTRDHYCRTLDGVVVCSREPGKRGIDQSVMDAVPLLSNKSTIQPDNAIWPRLFGLGWSLHEKSGRWTDGNEAVLTFRLDENATAPVINLTLHPFTANGRTQRVTVLVNGKEVSSGTLSGRAAMSIPIADMASMPHRIVTMTLLVPDAISPEQAGLSADRRMLGVALQEISLKSD